MREIYLALHNIRSTYNVGAILRTAEGMGVSRVIFSGYTPRPHDPKLLPYLREKVDHQIAKSALGAEDMVENYACDDIISELLRLRKEENFRLVGLENNLADCRVLQMKTANFAELKPALGKKLVLILGEEVSGIENSLREIMDLFLEIPMYGHKESFNVSVATGMALLGLRLLEEEDGSTSY